MPRPSIAVGGTCGNIHMCHHGNNVNLTRERKILSNPLWSNIHDCFHHYCRLTRTNQFCISENTNSGSANQHSSALSINTVQHIQDLNISCAIEITGRKLERILNFKCMWNALYYGIQSVITISDIESTVDYACLDLPEDGSHVMEISPWTLFGSKLEASCSLSEPYQQSCNYSLYITPWISNIILGESTHLTCPTNEGQLKWQEMSSSGIISLNTSEATITYYGNNVDENGVIIMCSFNSGNREVVLGIGKVIVRNSSSTLASTVFFDSTTEQDFEATITEKEIGPLSTVATTNPTLTVHGYAEEQMNRDLIVILVLTSSALLFCLGMGLLFIKYVN